MAPEAHHSHAVATILLLPCGVRLPSCRGSGKLGWELRTSAALAAAAFGSSAPPRLLPSVLPPAALPVLDGAGARAFSDGAGAFAGCAPSVRPSPWKFLSLSPPQQLPMVGTR